MAFQQYAQEILLQNQERIPQAQLSLLRGARVHVMASDLNVLPQVAEALVTMHTRLEPTSSFGPLPGLEKESVVPSVAEEVPSRAPLQKKRKVLIEFDDDYQGLDRKALIAREQELIEAEVVLGTQRQACAEAIAKAEREEKEKAVEAMARTRRAEQKTEQKTEQARKVLRRHATADAILL